MFPPAQGLRLDIDAISQIFGSISIACWIGMSSNLMDAPVKAGSNLLQSFSHPKSSKTGKEVQQKDYQLYLS